MFRKAVITSLEDHVDILAARITPNQALKSVQLVIP